MTSHRLVICRILAVGLATQYPCNGLAEDRSPTGLLREASINAARIDDENVRHSALLGILTAQQRVGDEVGAMETAELESLPGNRDNAWASVVAIQASKGNIT